MKHPSHRSVIATNLLTLVIVLAILSVAGINVDRAVAQAGGPDGPLGTQTTTSPSVGSQGDGMVEVEIPLNRSLNGDGKTNESKIANPEVAFIDPFAPDMLAPTFSYFRLLGTAFNPRTSTTTYGYNFNGCIFINGGSDNRLMAPLLLPENAVIKYLRLYYDDTDPTYDLTAWITRYQPGVTSEDVTSLSSTGNSGYGTTLSLELDHTVDLTNWAYTLIVAPNTTTSATSFCGVRVAYYAPDAYAIALPSVLK